MNAMQMHMTLHYVMAGWAVITAALAILVIYGNTLSTHEDGQLYLSQEEDALMGAEQRALVQRMHHLAQTIAVLGAVSAVLFFASAGMWVWIGLS